MGDQQPGVRRHIIAREKKTKGREKGELCPNILGKWGNIKSVTFPLGICRSFVTLEKKKRENGKIPFFSYGGVVGENIRGTKTIHEERSQKGGQREQRKDKRGLNF